MRGESLLRVVWSACGLDGSRHGDGQRDRRFTTSGLSAGVDLAVSDSMVLGVSFDWSLQRRDGGWRPECGSKGPTSSK